LLRIQRLDREGKLSSNAGQRLNLGLAGLGAGAIANSILDFGTLQLAGGAAAAAVVGATLGVCSALPTSLRAGTREPEWAYYADLRTLAGANYAHINPGGLSVLGISKVRCSKNLNLMRTRKLQRTADSKPEAMLECL